MNRQWPGFSPEARDRQAPIRPPRRGTTLIEVLAGLVVLGTLLTSVAIARGRFLRQWADADKRLRAAHSADAMLEKWIDSPSATVPMPGGGPVEGSPGYTWRTIMLRDPSAGELQAVIVRLEVYEPGGGGKTPILKVDFLRHEYPRLPRSVPTRPGGNTK